MRLDLKGVKSTEAVPLWDVWPHHQAALNSRQLLSRAHVSLELVKEGRLRFIPLHDHHSAR